MIVNISILNRYIRKTFLNKHRFISFLVLFIAVFIFLNFSCKARNSGQDISPETQSIKNTILLYNALLAEGYRNLNMNQLVQAATEQRATKAYYHMAALGEARIKMEAKLRDIKFLDFNFNLTKAEVKTEEIWDYAYINIDTGKLVFDNSITYTLKYVLERKSDKWLVSDINIEQSREKKDSSNIDIFHRTMNKETHKK